jgi:hypothetical protein
VGPRAVLDAVVKKKSKPPPGIEPQSPDRKDGTVLKHIQKVKEMRNAYGVFVGKPKGKRPFGKPRRRWENNIRMDLRG